VVCAGTQFTGCAADEKRIALRFVAHLVGDIHQPLHAGFAEDRGDNSVDVRFNGRKTNLHSLWDTGLVELEEGTPAEIAARIDAAVRNARAVGAGVARNREGASVSPTCIGRDQRNLHRARAGRDSDSTSTSWFKAGLDAQPDVSEQHGKALAASL
jgi:S1/P1 Nuclease